MSVLLQHAAEQQLDPRHQHQMLRLFLLLDKVPEDKDEEIILRGIRIAQMKLAGTSSVDAHAAFIAPLKC